MKRISARVVELTMMETLVAEVHSLLMDQGFSQGEAVIAMRGATVSPGLRTPSPVLDSVLTPEFVDWMCE
jgi:hypothetical protein